MADRTQEQWSNLCRNVKDLVPGELGAKAWYLVIAAALVTSPEPQLLGQFSSYLTRHDPEFASDGKEGEEARESLSLRLRDVCLKLMTLIGAPRVLSALMPLAQTEGEVQEKAERSVLNAKWQNIDVEAIHARGVKTIDTIYGPLLPKIFSTWGSHKEDVKFNELFTIYGLYMSDFEFLTALETEAVVYTSITCQGLRGPGLWHLRGMGRLFGARGSDDETEEMRRVKDQLRALKVAVITVVEFVGEEFVKSARVGAWGNVGDVVRELGGWGDD